LIICGNSGKNRDGLAATDASASPVAEAADGHDADVEPTSMVRIGLWSV